MPKHLTKTADSECDEQCIGDRADGHDHADVLTGEPLPQDKCVLRADRDDEPAAGEEAGQCNTGHGRTDDGSPGTAIVTTGRCLDMGREPSASEVMDGRASQLRQDQLPGRARRALPGEDGVMATAEYTVKGMTCGHCAHAVTTELKKIDGVGEVKVDVTSGKVSVDAATALDIAAVAAAIDEAGYELVS